MPLASHRWTDFAAIAIIIALVAAIYGTRLARLPIVGEESRWATGAREMLATGDWIVPRQQGQPFPERPPMTMWAMAAAGQLRGAVDPIAVRLPSVLAVVLTSLLVFGYTRSFTSTTAALVAAIAYATFGQVLQIGRMGESESFFTLLVSASLLLWHLGYSRRWPPLATWCIGFACAALAALVKGPQAPIYFGAITTVYLAIRRDWRFLFNWQPFVGAAVFVTIVAAWQIPFYRATDWQTVTATWAGLAADRVRLSGLVEHLVTYPLETFACLLPWSPLLVALVSRKTRDLLSDQKPLVTFLVVALAVAYPTVWIAAGARGRYFMPLYTLVAVLIGLLIDRCSQSAIGHYPRRAWHQFLLLWGVVTAASGVALVALTILAAKHITEFPLQHVVTLTTAVFAFATATALWFTFRNRARLTPAVAAVAIAAFTGFAYAGLKINLDVARWHDPTQNVAELKSHVPPNAALVSLTPIEHRFVFYYDAPITELDWPETIGDLPANVEYFCFMRNPGDIAASRAAGRGRVWTHTSGTLPFAWEEIAAIPIERRVTGNSDRTVVLGRVIRPLQAAYSDATVPQHSARTTEVTSVR